MIWVGKAVGGVLGLMVGSYVGAAVGLLVGHQFDRGLAKQTRAGHAAAFTPEHIQAAFFRATFAVMGHIAKGRRPRVGNGDSRGKAGHARDGSSHRRRSQAPVEHFTEGKNPGYPLDAALRRLHDQLQDRPDLTRAFVEIQVQAAVAAGPIDRTKRNYLWQVARGLGLGRVELAQIEALVRAHQARGAGKDYVQPRGGLRRPRR